MPGFFFAQLFQINICHAHSSNRKIPYSNPMYASLMYAHLITVVPCFVIGTILIIIKKGGNIHKVMGRIYIILMLITAVITLFMPAKVGPQFLVTSVGFTALVF
jgi:hypothetical protein